MEIFNPHSNINFMGWRKVSLAISGALMILAAAAIFVRGLDYGLDFTGGVMVEVKYDKPIDVADVRAALTAAGMPKAMVQSLGSTEEYAIRLTPEEGEKTEGVDASEDKVGHDKVSANIKAALSKDRPDVTLKPSVFVGPQVGEELRTDGLIAVVFVIIGIAVYLWIRFEWRFAIAAVASEIHDALITVGLFALTGREFDLTSLAAVLSVVGYSINDKIVVFDRVRELFRSSRKADPEEVLNRSINSTMSRTLMTGLTTALAVGTLFFFGGPTLENFALIMLMGIVIGVLSSIFFANPILLWLGVSKKDLMPVTRDNPELARRP